MAKIKIMQFLCPKRHCIVALAFDGETMTETEAQAALKNGVKALHFNGRCGICGSGDLRFETGETKFESLAEASSHLIVEEQKNLRARSLIESIRRTARNN